MYTRDPRQSLSDHLSSGVEGGVAIISALFFVIVVGGLVSSGTLLMKANTERADVRFRREAQADQFARSGLTEALAWMRRQTSQPVVAFAPALDLAASPQQLETDEPDIGLVREFRIADDIWGRYEVWKKWDADPDATRLAYRQTYQCEDLSAARGHGTPGTVWLIRSVGYVFQRRDTSLAFNQLPNRVLAMANLECEARRPVITLPTQAAVSAAQGGYVSVGSMGEIDGDAVAGIGYPSGSGSPSGSSISGTPALLPVADYDDSLQRVFGLSESGLRAMADLVITDPADFPEPLPDYSIVFCDCPSISFDAARSLNGTALVYFTGDVSLVSGNNSLFSGMLYVAGSLGVRESSQISGAVVVRGKLAVQGGGTKAGIQYDARAMEALVANLGVYRWTSAMRAVLNRE